jgi:hypothetical protein
LISFIADHERKVVFVNISRQIHQTVRWKSDFVWHSWDSQKNDRSIRMPWFGELPGPEFMEQTSRPSDLLIWHWLKTQYRIWLLLWTNCHIKLSSSLFLSLYIPFKAIERRARGAYLTSSVWFRIPL